MKVMKKDKYGKDRALIYEATQALGENGRIVFTIDPSFTPTEEGETLCVEIIFKKHDQGNQTGPMRITYKAQKIWYVNMPGW